MYKSFEAEVRKSQLPGLWNLPDITVNFAPGHSPGVRLYDQAFAYIHTHSWLPGEEQLVWGTKVCDTARGQTIVAWGCK